MKVVPESDKTLVLKAKQGDKQAFSELVLRYEKKIYSLVLHLSGNKQDAEDLTQEVFVRAYFSLKNYREESQIYTWLYRIAYNMSIDFKRRMASRLKTISNNADESQELLNFIEDKNVKQPDELLEQHELSLSLKQALSEISEEHRAVMILREVDGLSYEEIAKITGSAKGTVMSRLHYARKHLQRSLSLLFAGKSALPAEKESETESLVNVAKKTQFEGGLVDLSVMIKLVITFFYFSYAVCKINNIGLNL